MGLLSFLFGVPTAKPGNDDQPCARRACATHEDICPECGGDCVVSWLEGEESQQEQPCPMCNGTGVLEP